MKVVVTGATGVAGKEIVKHCIADARITKVVILTRRAVSMDVESHPKAEVVMHQDYSRYSEELLRRLAGAEACIWAIGGRVDQDHQDKELLHKVTVEYPLAAATTMCDRLAASVPPGKKFNFVFCSSKHAEKNQAKALLFPSDAKRNRGEAEKALCELADANSDRFAAWILRPSGFLAADAPKRRKLIGGRSSHGIEVSRYGRAVVRVACEGWKDRVVDNDALVKMSQPQS